MKLFSGSAHPQLTDEVAKLLTISLAKSEFVRFDDSEIKITIQDDVKDQECVVIQTTINPTDTHYMELFLFADALKRSEAKKLTAVIPYFGYSRQNMQHRPGECVSLNVIVRFLELVGYDKVITFDLHEAASADMFSIPFENISALPLLANHLKEKTSEFNENNTVVLSPDQEGIERARLFSDTMFGKNKGTVGSVEKHRNLDAIHHSQAIEVQTEVKGKKVILVDDVVTSGGTLINAANLCIKKGATELYAVVTHPDFSPTAPEKLQNSDIKIILTSNTIPLKNKFDKIKTASIASLIAGVLK